MAFGGLLGSKKKKAPKEITIEVAEFREKPKTIKVTAGKTVAECVKGAGFTIDATTKPDEAGLRLNGKRCKWTDKVTTADSFIYFIPKVQGGRRAV